MTFKATITNTSNWTNEHLLVTVGNREPFVLKDMKSLHIAFPGMEFTIKVQKAGKHFGQEKSEPYMNEDGQTGVSNS